MTIAFQWVLWFVAYSFMGWVYESIICSIAQKKFINRGFLNGPLCVCQVKMLAKGPQKG